MHILVLGLDEAIQLSVLSVGVDGAANKIPAQGMTVETAHKYVKFDCPEVNMHIKTPLFGPYLNVVVVVQDPKPARNLVANQIVSGARLMAFGHHYLFIEHLALIIQSADSSLYQKDVFNCDKQENGQIYCTFNESTLEINFTHKSCTSLAFYLSVMGELCDVWLSKTMSLPDRTLSAYTLWFSLRQWNKYLLEKQYDTGRLISAENMTYLIRL